MALMPTARTVAYDVLMQWSNDEGFVGELLESQCRKTPVSPADRRLAHELCLGVVRRQGALDAILRPRVRRGLENVEVGLRRMLQLGAYQLIYLSGIPAHAAVHETVELAKLRKKPQWTAILNGILRGISRIVTDEIVERPSARAIPLNDGRYRLLAEDVFPSPEIDAVGYIAEACSFPRWLPQRWQVRMGTSDLMWLAQWFNAVPAPTLRVNLHKTSREDLLAKLTAAGVAAAPGNRPESIQLAASVSVKDLPGFAEGEFTIQDESAMAAAAMVAPQPGERVLDLCAAPGGKTTYLAELMRNQGSIVATDVTPARLKLVDETAKRLGLSIIHTVLLDRQQPEIPGGPFDAILVDAPCSNTGVLGKRPEARWRLRTDEIPELQTLQLSLLATAAGHLAPHGRLVYSTCSIEPEENRAVIDQFLATDSSMQLVEDAVHFPGKPADGGYRALLRRRPRGVSS